MKGLVARPLLCAIVALAAFACKPAAPPLRPVTLPDLSSVNAGIRTQIQARYGEFSATAVDTSRPAGDRAAAFGGIEIGRAHV